MLNPIVLHLLHVVLKVVNNKDQWFKNEGFKAFKSSYASKNGQVAASAHHTPR